MAQPLIGISCSVFANDERQPVGDRLGWTYSRAVAEAGGLPMLLPNLELEPDAVLGRLDGLVLSGGEDVAPACYGDDETHPSVVVTPARDALELPLIRRALALGVPMLGICRGIQAINVALGGTLYQDLPTQRPSEIVHRQADARDVATHALRIEPGSRVSAMLGEAELRVNSFHHQAIRDLAPGLRATAWAEDGLIEAVESADGALVAVQYHPEERVRACPRSAGLFASFVDRCR